jgi:hypothetical protein
MRAPLLTLAALAAVLGGCREKQADGAIPRQRFVRANVDLRSIPDTAPRGDSLRKAALKKNRVTEADLRRFVEVHHRPEYLATVWREVADSVQKRYDRSFPALDHGPRPGVGIAGTPVSPAVATLPGGPPHTLPAVVRKPPPAPRQPPPPVTEPPRPMVRAEVPPARHPPANPPVDARHPMTRPGQRPLAPIDTLDRRR